MSETQNITDLIKAGHNSVLEQLLVEQPELASSDSEQGISLLQFAAYCRNNGAVDLFRQHKQPDIFEAASLGEMEEVVRHLHAQPEMLNQYSADGYTPLGLACFFGHLPIVQYIIEQGADVNKASNNAFQVAPLHSACAISNHEIAEMLLRNGAKVNAKQMQGVTPLHSAAHNGQTQLTALLLAYGADAAAKMESGQTPVDMAVEKGYKETAQYLKQHLSGT